MIERWRSWPPYARGVSVRLACLPLVLFVLYSAMFVLLEVWYDPVATRIAPPEYNTPAQHAAIKHALGRDDPMLQRYGEFWRDVVTLDFGHGAPGDRDPDLRVVDRLRPTSELLGLILLFGTILAVGAGALATSLPRNARSGMAVIGAAIASGPIVLALVLLIVLPSRWWSYAPPIEEGWSLARPWHNIRIFVPPALVVAIPCAAWALPTVARWMRNGRDQPRPPRITELMWSSAVAIAAMLPVALSAIVVVESVFSIDGLGSLMKVAAYTRDATRAEAALTPILVVTAVSWVIAPWPVTRGMSGDPAARRGARPVARRDGILICAIVLPALYVLLGIVGPWITPYDAGAISPQSVALGASLHHPFGTDNLGRDIFSMTIAGFRPSLEFTGFIMALGFLPGVIIGSGLRRVAGRYAALIAELASAVAMLAFVPLALAFILAFGYGWKDAGAAVAVIAFAIGLNAGSSVEGLPASWRALAQAGGSCVAIGIFAQTMLSGVGFNSSFRPDWGQLLASGAVHGSTSGWLGPAIIISLATFGFLLLRAALDGDVPPLPYER